MEQLNKTIDNINEEIKEFKIDNQVKVQALEQKNADLEKKNEDFAKEIAELKKENLENARQISEFSIRNENKKDGSTEVECKYMSDMDSLLRGFAQGVCEIKTASKENVEKLAMIQARDRHLSDENLEKKYVKSILADMAGTAFPALEVKTMNTSSGTDGGFLITPPTKLPNFQNRNEKLGLNQLVDIVSTSSNMAEVTILRESEDGFWEGEMGSDKSLNPGVDKVSIPTSIVKGVVPQTRTFMEDYDGNVYNFLFPYLNESLNKAIERALFTGDGVNSRPMGIANYEELPENVDYEAGKIKTVSVSTEAALIDEIIRQGILSKVDNPVVVMNPKTLASIALQKDSDGRPLIQPSIYVDGVKYTIGGMPIITSDKCPTFDAVGSKAVFIGDFRRAYVLLKRTGRVVDFEFRPNSNKEIINYMLRERSGGRVRGFESFVIIKKGN